MVTSEGTVHRIEWNEVPELVRSEIERHLGAKVRTVNSQRGGFSHGMAARLVLDDGVRVFAKAICDDDALAPMYRAEADTAARLPQQVPAPSVRCVIETAGWFVTVFEDVEGRHPLLDRPNELAAVLAMIEQLAEVLTPSPLAGGSTIAEDYGPKLTCWRQFAEHSPPADLDDWSLRNLDRLAALESTWFEPAAGETLLHTDLRPDNMLLRPDGTVVAVDWAWPCRGAAWIDLVSLAPSMAAGGLDPDPILAAHPVTRGTNPAAIDAFVCALVGYWEHNSRRPAPPKSPKLRSYQACSALVSRKWLRRRLAWP
ncbi:phosphotransferase family protein [Nocardia sp. XZ_19_369]|uniref:phosphotransferase family protein n=1 Tax=Nocardia sp. XZ_19_369 TaxID=2769487 RepID=UPI00188E2578|nr:aminoglycoside phosphotransferase family protein [Nocardia sp. XZ_19_369]